MSTNPRPILPLLVTLALAVGLSACAGSTRRSGQARSEVYDLIRHGRFDDALSRAEELRQAHPDDPDLEQLHREASVSWLLDRGRAASFADDEEKALQYFERARQVDPNSAVVEEWIEKTNTGLAERWLNVALNLHAQDDLDGAIGAYSKALDYVPGHPSALRGLEEALLLRNYRLGKGEGYYQEGVQALADSFLQQARWHFSATGKYLPDYDRAQDRRGKTDDMLAEQRTIIAHNLEEAGLFGAALRDYELAARLDSKNAEAEAGRERVAPEAEAKRLLDEAAMLVLRERYDEAVAQVDRAAPLTQRQTEAVEAMRERIAQSRLETVYQRALALERDQLYPEAIAAYEGLLGETDYYKDAQTRRSTLEEYVRLAKQYYEQAADESDPAKRLEYLRAIRGFWSEYRDVADQVEQLEASLPPETDQDVSAPTDVGSL